MTGSNDRGNNEPRRGDHTGAYAQTARSRVKRYAERASYQRELIWAILDEGLICQVAFVCDGSPTIIPMVYARSGDRLLLHGSVGSRIMRELRGGCDACVSVTLLDGLVLSRSAVDHSMNYRSVVAFGRAKSIADHADKKRALELVVEHLVPGRSGHVRMPSDREVQATDVLDFPLKEVSAKVRSGPPQDREEDLRLEVWAGVVPLTLVPGVPETAPDLIRPLEPPDHARHYRRPSRTINKRTPPHREGRGRERS